MFYLIYFAIILIIPLYAQSKVRSAYSKYSQVYSTSGMTGAEVARKILDENGLYNVAVEETPGHLSDHYDPTAKTVRLSTDNYYGHSVAGTAVAAHEVGHAIQDAKDYNFMRIRHSLVPVANFGSNISWIFYYDRYFCIDGQHDIFRYHFNGSRCCVPTRYITS